MKDTDLYEITGGAAAISGTLISSVVKLGTFIMEAGRAFGSAIRYIATGKRC